jgi:Leucine-rich repeat (LRR) protein
LGPLTDADLPSHSGAEELVLSEMEEITDSGLAHLQNMNKLERLWLDDLNITDAGLAHLAGLVQLKSLSVDLLANEWNDRKGLITDAGLAHLADLTNLERLHVAGDGITDKGLEHLANLKSLRNVSIASANITQSGITELRRQLPEVKVDCRRLGRRKSRD